MGRLKVAQQLEQSEKNTVSFEKWWKDKDHLITIGSAGLTVKLANSIKELVGHHGSIKVKLASDKLDAAAIANEFIASDAAEGKFKILGIRGKYIAVGTS